MATQLGYGIFATNGVRDFSGKPEGDAGAAAATGNLTAWIAHRVLLLVPAAGMSLLGRIAQWTS